MTGVGLLEVLTTRGLSTEAAVAVAVMFYVDLFGAS